MSSSVFRTGAGSTSLKRCPRAARPAKRPVRYSFCSRLKPGPDIGSGPVVFMSVWWNDSRGDPLTPAVGSGNVVFISIAIPLITLFRFHPGNERFGFVRAFTASRFDDLMQGGIHILGH